MDEKDFIMGILFRVILALVVILGLVLVLWIGASDAHDGIRISRIIEVYDGDTVYVDIDGLPPVFGESIGIRLNGIDTPEKRLPVNMPEKERSCLKALAELARVRLYHFLQNKKVLILSHPIRDKYFRLNGDILADGESAVEYMLESPLAKPYDGGKKEPWKCKEE